MDFLSGRFADDMALAQYHRQYGTRILVATLAHLENFLVVAHSKPGVVNWTRVAPEVFDRTRLNFKDAKWQYNPSAREKGTWEFLSIQSKPVFRPTVTV